MLGIYALIKLTQYSTVQCKVHVLDQEFTPFFEETTMLNRGLWLSYLYKSHLSLSLSLSLCVMKMHTSLDLLALNMLKILSVVGE